MATDGTENGTTSDMSKREDLIFGITMPAVSIN